MGRLSRLHQMILIFLIGCLIPSTVFADLGDFGEAVEEEQEQSEGDEEESSDEEESDSIDSEDNDTAFMDFVFGLLGVFWYHHNASSWYPSYPYADTDNVHAVGHSSLNLESEYRAGLKRYRFSADIASGIFFQNGDTGLVLSTGLQGIVMGLFGPDLTYRFWQDSSGSMNQLNLGVLIPLVQHDFFILDTSLGWSHFGGLLRLDGFYFRAGLTTYPFQPLSFAIHGGGIFASGVTLGEWGGRIGLHIRRFEIILRYSGLHASSEWLHSVEIGGAVHF